MGMSKERICVRCGAKKPAMFTRAGTRLEQPSWYINSAKQVVCSPYCAGGTGGLDWKVLPEDPSS